MYMHITSQDDSSSNKKKENDLAFKASQEKGKARLEYESSSDDEVDDTSIALSEKNRQDAKEAQQEWHQVWWQEEEVLYKL